MQDETLTETLSLTDEETPLPEGWRLVRLGDICELNPTRSTLAEQLKNRTDDTATSFVQMSAVDERLGIIARPEIKPFGQIKKGYTIFAEDDVLFAKITPCMQNGKHAIATNLVDGFGFGSTEFHVLRPTEKVISSWLHYFLRQPYFLKLAMASFTGAVGQQRVPEKFLANFEIPLAPTIEEQRRIAAILDEQMKAVERARLAVEEQLKAARLLPNAFLRSVFESEDAQNWQKRKLKDVCRIVGGSTPSSGVPEFWNGEIVWITPTDLGKLKSVFIETSQRKITEEGYKSCATEIIPSGSVVMSSRAPIGHLAIVKTPFCTNQGCKSFIVGEETDSNYLYYLLKICVPEFQELGSGSTFAEISKGSLESFETIFPPIEEQKKFVEKLNEQMQEVEKLKKTLTEQLEAIKKMPSALLRKAFAGEV